EKGADQNEEARQRLTGKIDLHNHMVSPRALGHNKFLVICDEANKPRWTWTGSQNWTKTGLCTQANNSVLIDDPELAREYRHQWDLLEEAGDATPKSLKKSNSTPRQRKIGPVNVTLWFTPTIKQVDLAQARATIDKAARHPVLDVQSPAPRHATELHHRRRAPAGRRRAQVHQGRDQSGSEHGQGQGAALRAGERCQRRLQGGPTGGDRQD